MPVLHRPREVIRFGPFELDLRAGELRKQGGRPGFSSSHFESWRCSWSTLAKW